MVFFEIIFLFVQFVAYLVADPIFEFFFHRPPNIFESFQIFMILTGLFWMAPRMFARRRQTLPANRGQIGTAIIALFVLFGDKILSWYVVLPWQVTWSGAGVVGGIMLSFVLCVRRWPSKIRPHREVLLRRIEDVRFTLFAFVFVGVSDVFYKLDTLLFSFYLYPGPWIMLGFQALILVNIAGIEYEQLNLGAKMIDAALKIARKLVRLCRERFSEREN